MPALRLDVSRAEHWMYRARSEDIVGGQDWVVSKYQPDDWWYNHPQIHQIRDSVWYFKRCLGNESTCSLKYCHAHHFECFRGWLWLYWFRTTKRRSTTSAPWLIAVTFTVGGFESWMVDFEHGNRKQESLEVLSWKCVPNVLGISSRMFCKFPVEFHWACLF